MNDAEPTTLLARGGRAVGRHPLRVLITWLVLIGATFAVAIGGVGGGGLFDRLHSNDMESPGQAREASRMLSDAGSGSFASDTLLMTGVDFEDQRVIGKNLLALQRISAINGVESVVNPFAFKDREKDPKAAPFLRDHPDGDNGYATIITYEDHLSDADLEVARGHVDHELALLVYEVKPKDSERGSIKALVDAIIGQVGKDMTRGEGLALPVSFVVMIIVFGGFLAAGLPIIGAIASIGGALATLLGFSYLIELDATVVNIVTVLGLGLCIDYGLLVVSRFREELRGLLAGAPPETIDRDLVIAATGRTVDRAGRTVVFSAITVAIALAGLMFFPVTFMRASGAAGVSVVILALLVATTLIPALCALTAKSLVRRGGTEQAPDTGVFSRLATGVQRAPWAVIAVVLAVLVTVALPSLRMQLTGSGPEMLPKGAPERVFFETFDQHYPGLASPDVIYVTDEAPEAVREWADGPAKQLPGLDAPPQVVNAGEIDGRTISSVQLRTADGIMGQGARDLVAHLHANPPPIEGKIGGQAAGLYDFVEVVKQRAPFAALTVILATFLLLFLMTGSVVVPIKALIMNVISLGASLGALVWVFQDGHLEGLLGFSSVGAVEATIPVLVLAFGFGLSMDYEVFLLSRIVELHEQGRPTEEAVRLGLQRSGRIITSAALLMVIVFSGFVFAQVLAIKETGVALVLAIIIDATLVRMLLVPATMSVLGEWNWWAPAWMKRLHARFGIRE